jgi:hypothetical protein
VIYPILAWRTRLLKKQIISNPCIENATNKEIFCNIIPSQWQNQIGQLQIENEFCNAMHLPSGFEEIISKPLKPMISATLTLPCKTWEKASIRITEHTVFIQIIYIQETCSEVVNHNAQH